MQRKFPLRSPHLGLIASCPQSIDDKYRYQQHLGPVFDLTDAKDKQYFEDVIQVVFTGEYRKKTSSG